MKKPFSDGKSGMYFEISRRTSNGRVCRPRQFDLAGNEAILRIRVAGSMIIDLFARKDSSVAGSEAI